MQCNGAATRLAALAQLNALKVQPQTPLLSLLLWQRPLLIFLRQSLLGTMPIADTTGECVAKSAAHLAARHHAHC